MKTTIIGKMILGAVMLLRLSAYAEAPQAAPAEALGQTTAAASQKVVKPYRTFIQVQRYTMENNGESNPISNVRIVLTFPNKQKVELPGTGQFWTIGNGQSQEINRTFELPFEFVKNDGFKFEIQMIRKGSDYLPCQFDVASLSEFNRSYICKTDLGWQSTQRISADKQDKEGIQIRVFSDLNSKPKEVPQDAIAIR